ncbi:hypothetical protein LA080_009975 [Diaporthe eres]|nr:hypothetical protein LA080_009975 [Diaporthe eres]
MFTTIFQHGTARRQQTSQESLSLDNTWAFVPNKLATSHQGKTRVVCYDSEGKPQDIFLPQTISDLKTLARETHDPVVVVVENISLKWMIELHTRLHIDVVFFREHACNLTEGDIWKSAFSSSAGGQRILTEEAKKAEYTHRFWHADGVFERKPAQLTQRKAMPEVRDTNVVALRCEPIPNTQHWWQQWNTTMLHCEITDDNIHLILVDAPFEGVIHGSPPFILPTSLHVPVSLSYGGLVLSPLLRQRKSSLFDCLRQFFSHPWHLKKIRAHSLSSTAFLWLIAASTWTYNIRNLNQNINDVAFNDLRRPDLQGPVGHRVHNRLHELRQSLMDLRKNVAYARRWIPPQAKDDLQGISQTLDGVFEKIFVDILSEAETTDRFLMDTFQLLMSSINVLDSATAIQQAQSSQKLTQLAFIFIPLNLVTSIFGMNIMEINGSPLRAWVCVVVLIVTIACTVSLLMAYDRWEAGRTRWNLRAVWEHLVRWTRRTKPEETLDCPENK